MIPNMIIVMVMVRMVGTVICVKGALDFNCLNGSLKSLEDLKGFLWGIVGFSGDLYGSLQ